MRDGAAGRLLATLQAKEAMVASEDVAIFEYFEHLEYFIIRSYTGAIIASDDVRAYVFVLVSEGLIVHLQPS